MVKIKLCKECEKKRYANTSWCWDHYRSRERVKREEKEQRKKERKFKTKKYQESEIKRLEKKAWKLFSLHIRKKYAGFNDYASCYTCGVQKPYTELHAGHCFHKGRGRYKALDFDDRHIRPQCLTKESKLRMFNGINKPINKIQVGDKLWGFDENTFERSFCYVEHVEKFIPDELYEVQLEDGLIFYATPDHKIIANGKWVCIKDILHNVSTYDIMEL